MIGGGCWCDLAGLPRAVVRRAVRGAARRHHRRRVQPDRLDRGRRRRVPRHRPMELRQRLRTRRLAVRQLRRRDRRRCAATSHRGVLARRGRDRGHVDGVRPVPARAATTSTSTTSSCPAERTFVPMADEPCIDEPIVHIPLPAMASLGDRQRRASASRRGRSTTSSPSPSTRCRCSPTRRSPPTRCSSSSWPPPTPTLRAARALLYETAEAAWATRRPAHRLHARGASEDPRRGGVGHRTSRGRRRHRLSVRRRQLALRRLSAPAPPPRHPRRDPALPRQARHADHRGRHPRRPRRRGHGVLTSRGGRDEVGDVRVPVGDVLVTRRRREARWRRRSGRR